MTKVRLILILLVAVAFFVFAAGRLLVVNHPEHADVILVLAGETEVRPERGVELLQAGYAPRLILDVSRREMVFNSTLPELAQRWLTSLPQSQQMFVCPISGLSTREETHEADQCIRRVNAHNVLLVTSDFHTRRASSIFEHELPQYHFSVTAAYNPPTFGTAWWRNREWAKTTFYEWVRLLWWEAVDRWRVNSRRKGLPSGLLTVSHHYTTLPGSWCRAEHHVVASKLVDLDRADHRVGACDSFLN